MLDVLLNRMNRYWLNLDFSDRLVCPLSIGSEVMCNRIDPWIIYVYDLTNKLHILCSSYQSLEHI